MEIIVWNNLIGNGTYINNPRIAIIILIIYKKILTSQFGCNILDSHLELIKMFFLCKYKKVVTKHTALMSKICHPKRDKKILNPVQ